MSIYQLQTLPLLRPRLPLPLPFIITAIDGESILFDIFCSTFLYSMNKTTLLLALAYLLFNWTLFLWAAGSITYTAFHVFHGKEIKFKSALKSTVASYLPLLGNTLLAHTVVLMISTIFAILLVLVIVGARWLGFHIETSSPYFLVFCISMVVLLVLVVIYICKWIGLWLQWSWWRSRLGFSRPWIGVGVQSREVDGLPSLCLCFSGFLMEFSGESFSNGVVGWLLQEIREILHCWTDDFEFASNC